MSGKIVPTMSIFGFTSDPQVMTEKLFLYYVTSEYSQSVTFYGQIHSLKLALNKYATEPDLLVEKVREDLISLYNKYFPKVDINVTLGDKDKKLKLNIDIVTENEDGVVSNVNETILSNGVTITNLLDLIYR